MDRRRVIAAAVVVATAGAGAALTLPALATTEAERPPAAAPSDSEIVAALRRDLGLTADQARARLRTEKWAAGTGQRLRRTLADEYAGAWLNSSGSRLTIAVTDESAAATVRAAGAVPKVVTHSATELDTVKNGLDRRASAAGDEVPGWYVDVAANTVVVLARPGATAKAEKWARKNAPAGAVRVVTSNLDPKPLFDVRGGDAYFINDSARCSVGFSVVGGFVSAGHCGRVGATTTGFNQEAQGTFAASSFPGDDFSFVEVNENWTPKAVVNTENDGEIPVTGSTEAPVGSSVCRTGSTTGTRCGVIQALNVTVQYPEGVVPGLTQTDVCAEPGDSGGSFIAGDQAQGVTSGGSGDCTAGGETFFQPVNEILSRLNLTLVTAAAEEPPAEEPPAEPTPEPTPPGEEPPAEEPPAEEPPAEEPPAQEPPAECTGKHTFEGALDGDGDRQAQPRGRFFRASRGTLTACLDGPDGANFDLFLQRFTGHRWRTVAKATGETADEVLTFDNRRRGVFRYRVVSETGSGSYTLNF